MSRRRFTTAVRWFDLRLASNRFVFAASILALVGFAAFRAVRGDSPELAASRGLGGRIQRAPLVGPGPRA